MLQGSNYEDTRRGRGNSTRGNRWAGPSSDEEARNSGPGSPRHKSIQKKDQGRRIHGSCDQSDRNGTHAFPGPLARISSTQAKEAASLT